MYVKLIVLLNLILINLILTLINVDAFLNISGILPHLIVNLLQIIPQIIHHKVQLIVLI
jgi:hypothetical protein